MSEIEVVRQEARSLNKETRKQILTSFKERDTYPFLKNLLSSMDSSSLVEITHGVDELGKDIVMVRDDVFGRTVIGVVVKTGDIRGQTKGKVDEIISQANQALVHPANISSIANSLTVSVVWIILFGEISNSAHKRLKEEIKSTQINIYDLDWLVDNFTEHYPFVFFEGQVMDFVQSQIQQLEKKHIFQDRHLALSDCFIEPIVAAVDVPVSFDEEQFGLLVQKKKLPFTRLKSLLKTNKKVIISGDPGVGKSTALAKLVIDELRRASDSLVKREKLSKIEIPVYITAIEFIKIENENDLLSSVLPNEEISSRFIISSLFVDGLDEVSPSSREDILRKASNFSENLGCRLVVTSRKIDLIKSTPEGFNKYELLPFEFSQALRLVDRIVSDKNVLVALKDGLDKIKTQITLTPLSLHLLIEIAESHRELPASITELYERFCDLVLGRFDGEKGIEVLFEYLIKKRFLSALAYEQFFCKDRMEILEKEFGEFLETYALKYGWKPDTTINFSKEIERTGVLDVQEKVSFKHRSFLDYFTAQYIFDNREDFDNIEEEVVRIYYDEVWSEVSFFYTGLRRDIKISTLEKIFKLDEDNLLTSIQKLLTGRLLQAAWHTTTQTKSYGINIAAEYAITTRNRFLDLLNKTDTKTPKILADVFAMAISEYSFGSGFLLNEIEELFLEFREQPNNNKVYKMISYLWATQRFLQEFEIDQKIQLILEAINNMPELDQADESVYLVLLEMIDRKDKVLQKTIRKRISKLGKRHPVLFSKMLPPGPKPGMRRRKKQQ